MSPDARKRLVPPTGPHAPAAGDEGSGLSEALAEWLYERSGGIMWRGETYWQDRHREDARQWFAYADMLDLLAARRPADEGGLRAEVEALSAENGHWAAHENAGPEDLVCACGLPWIAGQGCAFVQGARAILARHPAEPSTPAPERCGAENSDYPGEYTCGFSEGHVEIRYEGKSYQHANPAQGAYWNVSGPTPAPEATVVEDVRAWQPGDADTRCQDCGHAYEPWFTDHWLWNRVIGGPRAESDPGGYLCPRCFAKRADDVFPNIIWRFIPEWTPRPDADHVTEWEEVDE